MAAPWRQLDNPDSITGDLELNIYLVVAAVRVREHVVNFFEHKTFITQKLIFLVTAIYNFIANHLNRFRCHKKKKTIIRLRVQLAHKCNEKISLSYR